MAQINISVPEGLKGWIDTRVTEGRYSSPSDYVRDLVRRDQEAATDDTAWLQAEINKGLASEKLAEDPRDTINSIVWKLITAIATTLPSLALRAIQTDVHGAPIRSGLIRRPKED